jgi:hypothetical protein
MRYRVFERLLNLATGEVLTAEVGRAANLQELRLVASEAYYARKGNSGFLGISCRNGRKEVPVHLMTSDEWRAHLQARETAWTQPAIKRVERANALLAKRAEDERAVSRAAREAYSAEVKAALQAAPKKFVQVAKKPKKSKGKTAAAFSPGVSDATPEAIFAKRLQRLAGCPS